jgi:predicted transcriptional regulator
MLLSPIVSWWIDDHGENSHSKAASRRAVYFLNRRLLQMSDQVSSLLAAPVIVAARFDPVLALTAHISASYVGANRVEPGKVPPLIADIHQTLARLARNGHDTAEANAPRGVTRLTGPIDPKKSVFPDHLLCIECGAQRRTLKRHLTESHQLTPAEYRAKFKLPDNYPMVAPNYSKTRSQMAKAMGLGKRPGARGLRHGGDQASATKSPGGRPRARGR